MSHPQFLGVCKEQQKN